MSRTVPLKHLPGRRHLLPPLVARTLSPPLLRQPRFLKPVLHPGVRTARARALPRTPRRRRVPQRSGPGGPARYGASNRLHLLRPRKARRGPNTPIPQYGQTLRVDRATQRRKYLVRHAQNPPSSHLRNPLLAPMPYTCFLVSNGWERSALAPVMNHLAPASRKGPIEPSGLAQDSRHSTRYSRDFGKTESSVSQRQEWQIVQSHLDLT